MRSDFEKQVQQNMAQFDIAPTDDAWKNIETRIKRDRRKVRIFFLLWCTAVIIGAGVIVYYWQGDNKPSNKVLATKKQVSQSRNKAQETINKEQVNSPVTKGSVNGSNSGSRIINKTDDGTKRGDNTKRKVPTNNSQTARRKAGENRKVKSLGTGNYSGKDAVDNYPAIRIVKGPGRKSSVAPDNVQLGRKSELGNDERVTAKANADDRKVSVLLEEKSTVAGDTLPTVQDSVGVSAKTETIIAYKGDTITPHTEVNKKATDASIVKLEPQASSTIKLNSNKKFRWGLSLSTGISDNVTGFLALGPSTKAANESMVISPTSTPGTALSYNIKPLYKSSFSYGVGVFGEYRTNRRLSISAGLNYHFYGVNVRVGSRVDSLGAFRDPALNVSSYTSNFYRFGGSGSADFKNKLHLIEVPIHFKWQLNRSNARPFQLFTGITPGILVRSNALHYNRYQRVFYQEEKQLNRLQLLIETGVKATLFKQQKYTIQSGPLLRYGVSNLTKREVKTNEHLLFIGLRSSITFK